MKKNSLTIIGWFIFLGLLALSLAGHHIFNPFTVGFGYYVIYVFSRIANDNDKQNTFLLTDRIIALCLISLLMIWGNIRNEVDTRRFVLQFKKICYANNNSQPDAVTKVCEKIQSSLDNTLQQTTDFDEFNLSR